MLFSLPAPLARVSGMLLVCTALLASTTRCGVPTGEGGLAEDAPPTTNPATTSPTGTPTATTGPTSDGNAGVAEARPVGNVLALTAGNLVVGHVVGGFLVPASGAVAQARVRYKRGLLELDGNCLASANGTAPGPARLVDCGDLNVIRWSLTSPELNYGVSQVARTDGKQPFFYYGLSWANCAVPKSDDANCQLHIVDNGNFKQNDVRLTPRDAVSGQAVFGAFLSVAGTPDQCLTDTGNSLVFAPCRVGQVGQSWRLVAAPGGNGLSYVIGYASPASDLGGCIGLAEAMPPILERYPCASAREDHWMLITGRLEANRLTARQDGQAVDDLELAAGDPNVPVPQLTQATDPTRNQVTWGAAVVASDDARR